MAFEFEIRGSRLVGRQLGRIDWQDIDDAHAAVGGVLLENPDVHQILLDLRRASLELRVGEVEELAMLGRLTTGGEVRITAIVPPPDPGGAAIAARYAATIRDLGGNARVFDTMPEAIDHLDKAGRTDTLPAGVRFARALRAALRRAWTDSEGRARPSR